MQKAIFVGKSVSFHTEVVTKTHVCKKCGKEFKKTRRGKEFCSASCQQMFWRNQKFTLQPWYKHFTLARKRCGDRSDKYFRKGIKCLITPEDVHKAWNKARAWMFNKPSIDRVDSTKDYTPDNIRIISHRENSSQGGRNNRGKSKRKHI